MLVILRLSLGCHFLYEGVWKIEHRDEFTAEPFLADAKGPAAPVFYAMLFDIDGRARLRIEQDKEGRDVITSQYYADAWNHAQEQFAARYRLSEEQKAEAARILARCQTSLKNYLDENRDEMVGYFRSLDALAEEMARGDDGSHHRKKRLWDRQQELRKQVKGWLGDIEQMGQSMQSALDRLLDEDQRARGPGIAWNPLDWSRTDQLNFAVTYGLTAIGLCLMLGFCTRLAALGGGAFMAFVVATQPSWPTIYPPAPPVVGHALLINKDFVEMVALFLLATTAAGRWGGLDHFLYRWIGRPIREYFSERV